MKSIRSKQTKIKQTATFLKGNKFILKIYTEYKRIKTKIASYIELDQNICCGKDLD